MRLALHLFSWISAGKAVLTKDPDDDIAEELIHGSVEDFNSSYVLHRWFISC